ncbi:cytochrome P450 [Nonomuraea gerenzanensis]|uniref:Putative cytochrome P450 hydroxylase n=1 Tax=Nonomuraea gerenzanensis TaxID=93944 RepID=A0A1M4EGJ8_9ACTN|nr:cytochrome P450 [Nonomuraea gerenzanensis]UBU09468.1 cytochrome P450 [Nonomuraea gerenzanensis]SBO97884.1 putative cytochrome P450 hydroxylase [Nonomuraea gerenzanensis]
MSAPLPTERRPGHPFDPPAGLAELREHRPLSRLAYPDGHEGWLVTSHALVREVLADPRFSVRPDLRHLPVPGAPGSDRPPPPGMFGGMDAPEHTRYRRLLTGKFTVRRMRLLSERVSLITEEHLAAMERQGGPVDLVTALAQPIPAQLICELLGVPYQDRARFQQHALDLFRLNAPPEELAAAYGAVHAFIQELVTAKRADPTDDLLSDLTGTDLTEEELVNIGFLLLGAGLDTTANMLALGVFALLTHPDQLAALRADPGLAERAVEELLRYASIIPFTVRTALTDVELNGEVIKAGESVTVSVPAANRDPAHFTDPDTLDLSRRAGGHVAFGHGAHQCLGQQLARVELQVALPALVGRFPGLRLAVPAEDVPLRTDMLIYGVHRLPVTWGA